MGEIRVGTCSWTDKALVSSGWYPTGHRDAEGRLRSASAERALRDLVASNVRIDTHLNLQPVEMESHP